MGSDWGGNQNCLDLLEMGPNPWCEISDQWPIANEGKMWSLFPNFVGKVLFYSCFCVRTDQKQVSKGENERKWRGNGDLFWTKRLEWIGANLLWQKGNGASQSTKQMTKRGEKKGKGNPQLGGNNLSKGAKLTFLVKPSGLMPPSMKSNSLMNQSCENFVVWRSQTCLMKSNL